MLSKKYRHSRNHMCLIRVLASSHKSSCKHIRSRASLACGSTIALATARLSTTVWQSFGLSWTIITTYNNRHPPPTVSLCICCIWIRISFNGRNPIEWNWTILYTLNHVRNINSHPVGNESKFWLWRLAIGVNKHRVRKYKCTEMSLWQHSVFM